MIRSKRKRRSKKRKMISGMTRSTTPGHCREARRRHAFILFPPSAWECRRGRSRVPASARTRKAWKTASPRGPWERVQDPPRWFSARSVRDFLFMRNLGVSCIIHDSEEFPSPQPCAVTERHPYRGFPSCSQEHALDQRIGAVGRMAQDGRPLVFGRQLGLVADGRTSRGAALRPAGRNTRQGKSGRAVAFACERGARQPGARNACGSRPGGLAAQVDERGILGPSLPGVAKSLETRRIRIDDLDRAQLSAEPGREPAGLEPRRPENSVRGTSWCFP